MTGGDRTASLYAELLDALTYPDYTMIVGVDTRSIYDAFCLLESHYEIICDDIEHGTINALVKKNLSPGIDEYITKKSRPHPERAAELRAIFREGFDAPVVKKIWPKFRQVATGNDVNNAIYTYNLKRYIGEVVCREIGYNRPETYIGKSLGNGRYKLDIQNTYFEFMKNFLSTLYKCYKELDKRFSTVGGKVISKTERIEQIVLNSVLPVSKAEICEFLPDVSPTTVEAVLGRMIKSGEIKKLGQARATKYVNAKNMK
jgi:hypothetical protein